ncbi:MAG: YbaK/EbsC family protein [Candidatus Rokubacteria bacterium]|nr:YbaK/EbsC family protein [Candidatus Rokubacteria bacterium]
MRYEVIAHAAAVTAQEQAAVAHVPGRSFAKVLIVKERDGYVMAILPAAAELDLDRLKGLIGHGEVRLATVEEIHGVVPDCAAGAIPPFGALYGIRSFIDHTLLATPQVTMPAGHPGAAIRMRSAELRRIGGARPGDFAVPVALVAAGGVARPRGARGRTPSRPPGTR